MSRGKTGLTALVVLVAVGLVAALALAAPVHVEKVRLDEGMGKPDELLAYDSTRLLLLTTVPFEGETSIQRVFANGSPDPSFGEDGRLQVRFSDVAVAPDGKILLVDSGSPPDAPSKSDAVVTRLLPDGGIDPSFGDGGTVRIDFGGSFDGGSALAVLADGKIGVGGTRQTSIWVRGGEPDAIPALARLLPDGELDRSFSGDGTRLLLGGSDIGDLTAAPGEGIVVEGESYLGAVVWKLRESGSLDRRFGEQGSVVLEGRGKRERYGWEEEIELIDQIGALPSGKVLLAGTGSSYPDGDTHYRVLALRLRSDGRIDRSYGRRGYAMASFGGWTFARSMVPLAGGRLIVTAGAEGPKGRESDVGAIAFDRDGRLDRRFGNGGKVKVDLLGWDAAKDAAAQAGRLRILGWAERNRQTWLVGVPLARRGVR